VYTNEAPRKGFVQETRVKFRVGEVFKGLPEATQEVWIDPGSYTSCYASYELGTEFLVFAYSRQSGSTDSPATTEVEPGPPEKPLPPGFNANTPVYLAPECSGTRPVSFAQEDIQWLRRWRAGRTHTSISGNVIDGSFQQPLSDVAIVAKNETKAYSTKTDADGKWSIESVPAGSYQLTARLAKYRAGFTGLVDVNANSCATWRMWMEASGAIPVRVVDAQGRPVAGVELNVAKLSNGKPEFGTYKKNSSEADGRFVFTELPSGDYIVGVNLHSVPSVEVPYERTFLPGSRDLKGAQVIRLGAGERAAPVKLRLPPKIGVRTIRVRVRDIEGRKAEDGLYVFAEGPDDAETETAQTDRNGVAVLHCLATKSYRITAQMWLSKTAQGENQKEIAEPVKVEPGENEISLVMEMTNIEVEKLDGPQL
jgi:hypothetical protein